MPTVVPLAIAARDESAPMRLATYTPAAGALVPHAHVAPLDPQTLRHPMLRGARAVPRYGLTLGLAEILQARTVVLLVSGLADRTRTIDA